MSNLLSIIMAIIAVESGGNNLASNGVCIGTGQLTPVYVEEVNRIYRTEYTLEDRTNELATIQMMSLTFTWYAKPWWTVEDYALFHLLGGKGMKRRPLSPEAKDHAERVKNRVEATSAPAQCDGQGKGRKGTP